MGTDNSASDEWIELYNNSADDVDLTGWKLEATDGRPTIELEGTIEAGKYFLLERTDDNSVPSVTADLIYSGALGNSGEWLKLFDAENNLIDEINATDGWPAGDNATKQTMERIAENSWANSLKNGGTPKAQNSATEIPDDEDGEGEDTNEPEGGSETEKEPSGQSAPKQTLGGGKKGDILITEVLPNPAGIDLEQEFIEVKNVSHSTINLTNWKIKNLAKQEFIIPSLTMQPKSIVVFYRPQTNLALNNLKEKITLYNKSGTIISRVEYKSPAPENLSYQINDAKKYTWQIPTPGQNYTAEEVVLPVAVIQGPKTAEVHQIISLDASDSFDPEQRQIKYLWDFGDGRTAQGITARQIYLKAGKYEIKLTAYVSQQASSTDILKIKITGENKTTPPSSPPTSSPTSAKPLITYNELPFIFISEFLPNPDGRDAEGEFIEIFNFYDRPVNLADWQLTDGVKTFTFDQTIIKPGQYLAFFRPQTKIALNNDEDEIKLIAPNGEIADLVSYEGAKEGQSFVLDENFIWRQSATPSPGEINILDETAQPQTATSSPASPVVLGTQTEEVSTNQAKNKNKYFATGIAGIFILGLGAILKFKKNKN